MELLAAHIPQPFDVWFLFALRLLSRTHVASGQTWPSRRWTLMKNLKKFKGGCCFHMRCFTVSASASARSCGQFQQGWCQAFLSLGVCTAGIAFSVFMGTERVESDTFKTLPVFLLLAGKLQRRVDIEVLATHQDPR